MTRYAEGAVLCIHPHREMQQKLHAVRVKDISLLTSLGAFRPAVCGKRVKPAVRTIGKRKFLAEFDASGPRACKRCIELIRQVG